MSRLLRRLLDGVRSRSAPASSPRRTILGVEAIEDRLLLSGTPFDVSGLIAGGQRTGTERAVARAEDGTFAVVWDGPGSEGLYVRLYDATGTALTAPQAISGTGELSSQASVGVNGSGGQFVVVWAHNGDIRAQRFAKTGGRVGGVIDVAATSAGEFAPSVAVDDWGNFSVAYTSQISSSNSDIVVKRFDKNGVLQRAALTLGSSSTPETDPAIAISPAGFTVVTWTTVASIGNRDIHAQRIDYRGNLVGGRLTIANTSADEAQSTVTVDRNGHFVVAYAKTSGGQGDIVVRRYSATAALRSTINVTTTTTTSEFSPSIAGTRDGAFTVVWTAEQGSDRNVVMQAYNTSGAAIGGSVPVAGSTTQDEQTPSVGVNSSGVPVVVYENHDAKSGAGGVYARVYGGSSFTIADASLDDSTGTAFRDSALRFSYGFDETQSPVTRVVVQATLGTTTYTLGTFSSASVSEGLINLASVSGLADGTYQIRATATFANGKTLTTPTQTLRLLSGTTSKGNFTADTLNYSTASGNGAVFFGSGGTDVLNLGLARSLIVSLNGLTVAQFNPTNSTTNQAVFKGSAYDYIRLSDGREIYFQGIERLKFSDNSMLDLVTKPNDPYYASQWNLHVSDVEGAWRFTQGSSNVLLVSLDTGILTAAGASGGINDISTSRLLTDATDDDNYNNYGHGHSAISIMVGRANNAAGIAGVNAGSTVFVNDVYNGVSLQQGIKDALAYAKARGMKIVFQAGIQGEFWLNSGGTQAELEKLLSDNEGVALLAVAAGNGNVDINATSGVNTTYSGGVARLAANHSNVIAVGALQKSSTTTANGLSNAGGVQRASYSNYGSALTLMGATDSPVVDKFNQNVIFNGTSASNPNVAAISSLVWSANTSLTGNQVRQILTETAIDLGAAGRDNTFGAGLINADAAVRRAVAMGRASDLANLYTASGSSNSGGTAPSGGSGGGTAPPAVTASLDIVFSSDVMPASSTPILVIPATGETITPAFWVGQSMTATETPWQVVQARGAEKSESEPQVALEQGILSTTTIAGAMPVRIVEVAAVELFTDLNEELV